ncbi:MAG: hypothetical protein ACLU20_08120 [Thomasclavelia spiroformis]
MMNMDKLLNQLDLTQAIEFIVHGNRDYLAMDSVGFIAGKFTENACMVLAIVLKTLSYNNYGETVPQWKNY